MAVPVREFIARLAESGLMSAEELSSFRRGLPLDQQPTDAQAFAQTLVEEGKLTEYQATAICRGDSLGLAFGEYVILERLGQGGMGIVLKARHKRMDRLVALKMLPVAAMSSVDAIERFYREVKAAAKLHHPNIVTAYDAGEREGIPYLAMEYVEGQDLATVVKQRGPLPVPLAIDWILQAARGLQYAHDQGIIHRDIKLANLLLDNQGTVKILDMGLARIVGAAADEALDRITWANDVMGTYGYMAPEQAESTRRADHRADIYSLGCSLHRLLTCEPIYRSETPVGMALAHREAPVPSLCAARADVPPPLDAIFQKMVAKRPEDRYQSMAEVVAEFEGLALLPGRPVGEPSDKQKDAARERDSSVEKVAGADPTATTRTFLHENEAATRKKRLAGPLGVALLGLAAVVAFMVIVRVRDRQGRETVVRAPEGSLFHIQSNGEIEVTLPEEAGQNAATAQPDFEPDPPAKFGPDAPQLAVAPFSRDEARRHQERWAAYLKVPREETNSIGMKTVLIPPGEFEMGSTREEIDALLNEAKATGQTWLVKQLPNEAPRHRVRLTSAFRLGAYEVTVGQFRRFVETTRYLTEGERDGKGAMVSERSTGRWGQNPQISWRTPGFVQSDEHPVVAVSWNDAAAFCRWLAGKEAKRCRLPTEAEWEYACRAGSTTRYTCGDDVLALRDYAWSQEDAGSNSHSVGQRKPNGFGLFDVHGNAWEWCADWYDPRYYSNESSALDPRGPASGVSRVMRGGSRDYGDQCARSANRAWSQPFRRTVNIGFRVALPVSRPPGADGQPKANP